MCGASGTLLSQLWDDWIMGTERRFIVQASLHYGATVMAVFSFGISHLTCGITMPVESHYCMDILCVVDWDRHVGLDNSRNVALWESCRQKSTPRSVRIDVGAMDRIYRCVFNSKWLVFSCAIGNFERIGIIEIPPGIELDQSHSIGPPTIVPFPSTCPLKLEFVSGDLVVLAFDENFNPSLSVFNIVPGILTSKTSFKVPPGPGHIYKLTVLGMRKRSGKLLFIAMIRYPKADSTIIEIPEGRDWECSELKFFTTKCTEMSRLSDSLFCLFSPEGSFCEIWDANDTTEPTKAIPLMPSVIPCRPLEKSETWTAVAHSGFIFHLCDKQFNLIEAATATTVLTLPITRRHLGCTNELIVDVITVGDELLIQMNPLLNHP
ncbi:hypothetical protein Pelo_14806 [Pelomyxa schiedti]|nr:hypothetical protein Pelo_14806 [Pelomyxa schiedti]